MTPSQAIEWARLHLREHGVSLAAFGSDEPGVHRDIALEVIAALDAAGITPLGIEVWRNQDNGFEYDSDVNADWHSSNLRPHRNCIDARYFLRSLALGSNDVVTVQVGEWPHPMLPKA